MRADWTDSGACINGSTARQRGATRRASGGAATTNTTSAEPNRRSNLASRRQVAARLKRTGLLSARGRRGPGQRSDRHRQGNVEALALVASPAGQHVEGFAALDALRDNAIAKLLRHLDHRLHDDLVAPAFAQRADETLVDLHRRGRRL